MVATIGVLRFHKLNDTELETAMESSMEAYFKSVSKSQSCYLNELD